MSKSVGDVHLNIRLVVNPRWLRADVDSSESWDSFRFCKLVGDAPSPPVLEAEKAEKSLWELASFQAGLIAPSAEVDTQTLFGSLEAFIRSKDATTDVVNAKRMFSNTVGITRKVCSDLKEKDDAAPEMVERYQSVVQNLLPLSYLIRSRLLIQC